MAEGRKGSLKKDRQERFNLKRGWFVTVWRVVDEHHRDMVQPWFKTKREALDYAKIQDIEIQNLASFKRRIGRYK